MQMEEIVQQNTYESSTIADDLVVFTNEKLLVTTVDVVDGETPLVELGILDSLAMVSMLAFVETQFGVRIPDEAVVPENFETLQTLAALIARLQADKAAQPTTVFDNNPLVDAIRLLEASSIQRQMVSLDSGEEMHVLRVSGQAPTWVLLPGLGNPSSSWGTMLQSIVDVQAAIAVDFAGFGLSVGQTERPTYQNHVAATTSLLEAIVEPPYVLVGSSAGAMVAAEIARQHPEWVQALVITGFGLIGDVGAWWQRLLILSQSPEAFLSAAYYRPPQLTEPLQAIIEAVLSRPAYHSFLEGEGFAAMQTAFDALTVPTLFVAGQDDAIIPEAAVVAAAERVPHSQLEWLARCGHFPPAEQPEELVYFIRNFLDTL